jgi:hypothetical protein
MADEIARFLAAYPPDIEALTNEVRALVASITPDADENLKTGWKVIWFGFGPRMPDQFAVVMPTRQHVGLGFASGSELPDPKGKLEGVGKKMRHVKLRTSADVADPAVAALLRAQIALAAKAKAKSKEKATSKSKADSRSESKAKATPRSRPKPKAAPASRAGSPRRRKASAR